MAGFIHFDLMDAPELTGQARGENKALGEVLHEQST